MRKINFVLLFTLLVALTTHCTTASKSVKFQFDESKEMSGIKIALSDVSSNLPSNWDDYNYVVLEYKISTAQRFQLGFTTDYGYNEVRVMSYVPNQWNRLAIPLKYFTALPDPAASIAATFNHARNTGWINLGGDRNPLHGVDSIGFRMRKASGNPTLELRSVSLSVEDPGDLYMGEIPAVDEFGQSNLVDYVGKVYSLEELKADWEEEDAEEITTEEYNYSKFGGYKQKRVKATGYFRTEKINGKWWMVDPEGYLFLSVGADCVKPGLGGDVRALEERSNMYKEVAPAELFEKYGDKNSRFSKVLPYGKWNLYRRYGDDFPQKSVDLIFKRMDKWGLNTIANWSGEEVYSQNKKAFLIPLRNMGTESSLLGLCDVYEPNFEANVRDILKEFVKPYLKNPWLIGYFIGNEPAWLESEDRLCSLILDGRDRPIKTELIKHLKAKGDTPETRKDFVIEAFRIYLVTTNKVLKECDPNHLNLGIRFGHLDALDSRILEACGEAFDALSFNSYALYPNHETMDRALKYSKIPMIIGEYHFGASDRGMAQALWQVDNQKERGVAYRHYTEMAYAHPGLIGTGYFQWGDQDMTGRFDGENYNCGLVDVTDRPYKELVEAVMETSKRLYDVHLGNVPPYSEIAKNARGYELVPDLWNE